MRQGTPDPGHRPGRQEVAEQLLGAHAAAAELRVTLVEVAGSSATLSLVVGPAMVNGHGICHGGVIFGLADLAATVAATPADRRAVPTGSTIELVSPAPLGATVTARSAEVHARGRTAVVDTAVTVDGEVVALVRTRVRLADGRTM